jgi:hypothetical protein
MEVKLGWGPWARDMISRGLGVPRSEELSLLLNIVGFEGRDQESRVLFAMGEGMCVPCGCWWTGRSADLVGQIKWSVKEVAGIYKTSVLSQASEFSKLQDKRSTSRTDLEFLISYH